MQSTRLLELALKGLEAERARLEIEIAQVKSRLNGSTVSTAGAVVVVRHKRRKMSAAARKRISEGMRARWAARRKTASKK
jgi:hypothetical protein